ncbi:cell wall-associated NlpC family hydrolase [Amycolatopsis bartoniae]|uniref:C40 family peptidase n=1 Tax=Amycolatopsis bartoniae TaxID=941986 RepID=UPI0011919DD9|nr:C40 family peptidase [Amycolatopsis bartoniae]MBB2937350.1 cell wall-associated NlpC family hydrolase [Amycolatopsis bartoniae]TVT01596.1 NlpC/P60 family protein [Amycolatopsis bartoniae]
MTIRFPKWARAVAGRALIALIIVGALVTSGWILVRKPQPAPALPAVAAAQAEGNAATAAGPSVLEVSAPVQAQAPQQQGASELEKWAAGLSGALDIPERALVGYATGELTLRKEQPDCHLSWVTLAGIGKASSDHGRYGGDSVTGSGALAKALGAVPLQGAAGEAASEPRGGPMQLTQQEWKRAGTKGDLQDIDDAAVAAGRVLCAGGTNLQAGLGWWKAIANYRDSDLFRQQVLGNAQLYAALSLAPQTASAPSVRAVRFALDQLGLPYVWGGNGPDAGAAGFDCSGLTKAAYDSAGVSLPRTADSQFRTEPAVPGNQQPALGDLVFYGSPATRIHHVGLYLGNGLMINAPQTGMAIQIATYHVAGDDYAGAGRPTG